MFPTGWLLALAGASLMSHVTGQADTPEMVFDCNVTPGICTNMCFGAYCRGYDVSLNYDKPSGATKAARRNKAGCKSGSNRCTGGGSPDPDGGSCDEYPFAATSNADDVQAVNRCVPNAEQHSRTFAHPNWALLTPNLYSRPRRNHIILLPTYSGKRTRRVHSWLWQP